MDEAIKLHKKLQGKLEIKSKVKLSNKHILSLVYTPGVGNVVQTILDNPHSIYDSTIKKNTIAVITDGSAVLGLGNTGPEAALPVMEGKCAIFRELAGLNAFPICLKTQDTEDIVNTVVNISPVFGGINLEDISAPRCFEIERRLQQKLNIPVMHDDQHATAIIVLAGLINATKIVKKDLRESKIVISGIGAAGTATAKLLISYGCRNMFLVDSEGIINCYRRDIDHYKKELAQITNYEKVSGGLINATQKADVLIGLSKKDLFTEEVIKSMGGNSVVFALANPDPEITENNAIKWGVKVYANGRSDCKNQINNALVFPGFFKGLLGVRKKIIPANLKIKVATTIAGLVGNPTTGKFIPSIFDKSLVTSILRCF